MNEPTALPEFTKAPEDEHSCSLSRSTHQTSDFISLVLIGVRNFRVIASISLLCFMLGVIIAYSSTPIYRATVLVASSSQRTDLGSLGRLAELADLNTAGQDGGLTQEAIALLKSRVLTIQFIEKNNLLPVLFPSRYDARAKVWKEQHSLLLSIRSLFGLPEPPRQPTALEAFRRFDAIRSVEEQKLTGMVEVSIEWPNAVQAAQWANSLVKLVNEHLRTRSEAEGKASVRVITGELRRTSDNITAQVLRAMLEDRLRQIVVAQVRKDFALRVVDPAMAPDRPVRPNKLMYAIFGGFMGFVLTYLAFIYRDLGLGPWPSLQTILDWRLRIRETAAKLYASVGR